MQIIRQSTQVVVRIGPFVDVTDGFTPETGITLSGADEAELLKAAGAATVSIAGNTWAAIASADGWYDLTLSTTDTNTIGTLDVVVNDDSVCLPVFARFQVIEEAAYDAIYAASAAPATATNITAGVITTVTNLTNLPAITASWLTAAGTAADFGTEVAGAVWDMDATAHQTQGTFGQAIGDPVADTDTIYALANTIAAAAAPSAATIATAVWAEVLEGAYTAKELFRLVCAALFGRLSGAGSTNVICRDTGDSVNRIDATVDASGNRTNVTLDPS